MSVSLVSANASLFASICAGESGLDPYTQTVSEVYQDLFGEGSFIGKGIYDVRAFSAALEKRVPENALLSHDLFEGNFARAALVSDIELFDDFPSRYHVHSKRLHRWVRGDWQILPWIGKTVPTHDGKREKNTLSELSRWKLVDNLRRSLIPPALVIFFVLTTLALPGKAPFWVGTFVFVIAFPVYFNIASAFLSPVANVSIKSRVRSIGKDLVLMSKRTVLLISFLPHQAYLMIHAIAVTLWRLYVTKKNLLEWETAYHAERRLGSGLKAYFVEMGPGVIIAFSALVLTLAIRPESLEVTFPFYLLWLASPYIAKKLSDSIPLTQVEVPAEDREYLVEISWSTWRYFRDHMTPEHNFLIPDNVQLTPSRVVAPRTSPTNISLSMLGTVSAFDLGFSALPSAIERVATVFRTLGRLERFRGHFLNWYNTRTLDPLLPRYVSFVDSGNLVGHFVALRVFFRHMRELPLCGNPHLQHIHRLMTKMLVLTDKLSPNVTESAAREISQARNVTPTIANGLRETASALHAAQALEDKLPSLLRDASPRECVDEILGVIGELHDITEALSFFEWLTPFDRFAAALRQELTEESQARRNAERVLEQISLSQCTYADLHDLSERVSLLIREIDDEAAAGVTLSTAVRGPFDEVRLANDRLHARLQQLLDENESIIDATSTFIREIDFTFLYEPDRELFAIGYDVGNARRDPSYYDLLASEARLGSLVAIALGQVPQEHWFALGRPLADTPGGKALMAWGGTMFEYLMPLLLTRDYRGTILAETYRAVVKAQHAYGNRMGVPWGVSESAYSGVDFEKTYQYHAFGVPGLGLKRGLEEDLVISPYSTFMALPIDPQLCIENLRRLESEGARGEYGFYEAIDYTPTRLSNNERHHIVQSFFAHHQGMSLVSLNNTLNCGVFQERFHADQQIRATELLLQEKFPERVTTIVPATAHLLPLAQAGEEGEAIVTQTHSTPHTPIPYTHLLSNGRYSVMLDNAGSGWSNFERETQLTRWREDLVTNTFGTFIYVRDLESKELWSVTYQPTLVEPELYEVFYGPDKIEYKRRDRDIFIHTEITVSPEDNVEVRKVSLTNLSSHRRQIELTSFGEVVLQSARADSAHPAFSKMFVESEALPDLDALLFSRRPRSRHEERFYFIHLVTQRIVWDRVHYESSRFEFIGRGKSAKQPRAFDEGVQLPESVGYVLDPVFSLQTKVEIEPGQTEVVVFVSATARTREEALSLGSRYKEMHQISRAFEMAWSQSSVELRNEQTAARQWASFQKLGNALIFNAEKFRARPDVLERNRLAQNGLWRFGVSGDYPLCLVRVTEPDQTKLVTEALHAHNYLRQRGLVFELVILNEYPGGYLQNLQEELEYLIRSNPSGALSEKRGGVFLRTAQQLNDEERDLLHTVSRVILNGLKGTLAQQVRFDEKPFEPVLLTKKKLRVRSFEKPDPVVAKGEYFNGIGAYTDDGKSYALSLHKALPPLPWSNVVANREFGFLVTERGSGYTWSENCRENRLTPWSNDPVSDAPGEVIYIRDTATGLYWCPTPGPIHTGAHFRATHSFGKSVFSSEIELIESQLALSIHPEERIKFSHI
ncbi:MAG: cyclic beta 1-2 glucan synthetase, partial [Deltaproteobacteria bacterium]|nr:cyclic beta 1-2 glucan synthetase [Deltaproteobacteria bacterium]